ncbi:unnamed protein product [Adineta steineri]|uniref:Uncharacterized protein n=1 Tax=Adineta steineri TaxID=433720 RepID=A0A818QLI7_9BILA|nr:unnamed protein product [Adineta steineri]CAF3640555.1 unnamed protein product [Adineta steineri]
MAGYVTVNRLSRIQVSSEDRKQQAHLKKIGEMQRRSGLDTTTPADYPHLTQHFNKQSKEKNKQIAKENDFKLRKLLSIMQSKTAHPPPKSTNSNPPRQQSLRSSQNNTNTDYRDRIANTKSTYNVREWNKDFEEHKEHLRICKSNKLFTPCDIAVNKNNNNHQQRDHANATGNNRRASLSSTFNIERQSNVQN